MFTGNLKTEQVSRKFYKERNILSLRSIRGLYFSWSLENYRGVVKISRVKKIQESVFLYTRAPLDPLLGRSTVLGVKHQFLPIHTDSSKYRPLPIGRCKISV